MGNVMGLR